MRVKADGSMWVRADQYMESLGGKVDIENDGQLVVACLGEQCVPLKVGDEAEIIKGKPWAKAEALMRAAGLETPSAGVGLKPGDMAPDFTLESLEGTQVSLSDYRGEKVLVFAWASW